MSVDIKDQGQYELFETTEHHRILVLDGKKWFAAVKGQQGDILVQSDSDHKRDHALQKGHFYFAEFKGDPKFRDLPHLFLEKGSKYQEVVLPNGLPTNRDMQKKVVWTDDTMNKEELETYLENPSSMRAGQSNADSTSRGKQKGKANSSDLPIPNFDEMTVTEVTKRLGDLSAKERQQIRHYEQQNKKRKTLLEALDRKH